MNYVKRVIGLPGETVEFRDNDVYINGQLLSENRVIGDPPTLGDQQSALVPAPPFEDTRLDAKWTVYYSKESMEHGPCGPHISRRGYEFKRSG